MILMKSVAVLNSIEFNFSKLQFLTSIFKVHVGKTC